MFDGDIARSTIALQAHHRSLDPFLQVLFEHSTRTTLAAAVMRRLSTLRDATPLEINDDAIGQQDLPLLKGQLLSLAIAAHVLLVIPAARYYYRRFGVGSEATARC